jgi:hypothetical protein
VPPQFPCGAQGAQAMPKNVLRVAGAVSHPRAAVEIIPFRKNKHCRMGRFESSAPAAFAALSRRYIPNVKRIFALHFSKDRKSAELLEFCNTR